MEPTSSPAMVREPEVGITSSVLLTMPAVTDCDNASGLPIARTGSPTRSFDESPQRAAGYSPAADGISLMIAMSDRASVPISLASTCSLFDNVTDSHRASPATWWLVTTYPSGEIITPLPKDSLLVSRPSSG